ncbi:Jasmonate O-methyltransferase [Morella rubra]|uniref:Jasmonate O-methyltransferase n=1 Tax=Morella rubra TaxID=262757 RepID=A0A6A1UGN6_9ROSI|nr:Jasmonate O-methyltransferase [Morella rubra]
MEIVQVPHMNNGVGETSYGKNSKLQCKMMSMAKLVMEDAILEVLSTYLLESMDIADLGCSSGPNTLIVISQMIDIIHAKCCQLGRPMQNSESP